MGTCNDGNRKKVISPIILGNEGSEVDMGVDAKRLFPDIVEEN